MSFDENDYAVRFKAPRRPAAHQMTIHAPEAVASADASAAEVVVNVFNGSARSTIEMRFGDSGPWVAMIPTDREDPQFLRMKQLEEHLPDEAGKELPKPARTSHIWAVTLPANPRTGSHVIAVRTTDMFGQTYAGRRVIRVR